MNAPSGTAAPAPLRGVAFLLCGVAVLSLQDLVFKHLSGRYPVMEMVFIRTIASVVPLGIIVYLEGGIGSLRIARPGLHLARGLLLFMGYCAYYMGVAGLPLATVVAVFFSAPLLLTAMAALFLGEAVGPRRWAAVLVGFVGVLVMLRPAPGSLELGAVFALLSAVVYAVSMILTRKIGETDSGASMVVSTSLVYVIASGAAGLLMADLAPGAGAHPSIQFLLRGWSVPALPDLALMSLTGVTFAVGFYLVAQAYRTSESSLVAPFEYTGMLWGAFYGYLFWHEVPGAATVAGMAIVAASGLYVLHRESRTGPVVVAPPQRRLRRMFDEIERVRATRWYGL